MKGEEDVLPPLERLLGIHDIKELKKKYCPPADRKSPTLNPDWLKLQSERKPSLSVGSASGFAKSDVRHSDHGICFQCRSSRR